MALGRENSSSMSIPRPFTRPVVQSSRIGGEPVRRPPAQGSVHRPFAFWVPFQRPSSPRLWPPRPLLSPISFSLPLPLLLRNHGRSAPIRNDCRSGRRETILSCSLPRTTSPSEPALTCGCLSRSLVPSICSGCHALLFTLLRYPLPDCPSHQFVRLVVSSFQPDYPLITRVSTTPVSAPRQPTSQTPSPFPPHPASHPPQASPAKSRPGGTLISRARSTPSRASKSARSSRMPRWA